MPARRNKLVYLAPAARDMEEIVKYHLTRVGAQSARGIYEQMKKEIGRLSRYPLLGQTHPDPLLAQEGFRKLVLTDTYVAVYKIIDDEVVIYRIVNGRTDYPRLLK